MNLSSPFIRRPVMTTLVMLSLCIFGIFGYRNLPVSDLPNVDFPTIQVSASLPGASPETMASSVATPLEREFSTIAGVDSMSSVSTLGVTQITLQFNLARNIDAAAQDVQAAIARSSNRLPREMPGPPSYRKVNPADQPILFLAVTSPTLPLYALNEYADTFISQRISQLNGVAQVVVYGSQKYAVRIQVDPLRLAAMGIGIDEVADAIQDRNVKLPVGVISGPERAFTLESSGQLLSADRFQDSIIAYRNDRPVRLDAIGRAIDSVENDRTAATFRKVGREPVRAIVLAVQRQPGANTVRVVESVRALMPSFREQLPPSITVETLNDRSVSIRESVEDVKFTLVLTLCLVTLVIFLFLRNLRATLIPSLAMPLSLFGAFAVMDTLGFSLDNLSLMALTLSLGFVVDDAIVVLENIVRHVEGGKSPFRAALDGSAEIVFTIVSMTISLVAVFIPIIFMGGLVGRLLFEFSITFAAAILVSGVVSLTLTPMMCARMLRRAGHARRSRLSGLVEGLFDRTIRAYGAALSLVLRFKPVTLVASLAILAATVHMFREIPKGFLPNDDQGRIFIQTEAAEGTSFALMQRIQQAMADVVAEDPAVDSFMSSIGSRGGQASNVNTGVMFIRLKDRSERPHIDAVIQRLRRELAAVGDARAFLQNPPTIRIGGQLTRSLYQFTLQGPDTAEMYAAAPALVARIREIPGVQDVTTDLHLSNPQVLIDIDRDKAAVVGVTPAQIELALASAFGTRQVSTIYAPTNDYQVILELLPEFQTDPSWLDSLYVRSSSGSLVQLTSVATISRSVGPLSVNHSGQLPSVTISFNLAPGYSIGPAVDAVRRHAVEALPPSIATSFQGTAQAFESSLVGLGWLLVMALVVVYVVLGMLYESFIHPVTILTALPFAGFGALATLLIFNVELSLYAFVGVILLIGLVKKNGIMMVDFAISRRRARNLSADEAIHEACMIRFRPIMMTTVSALMGTLPIALGFGAGAESRRPLGLAVVGGLLFSQFVTLFATPVFYVYFDRIQQRLLRRRDPAQHEADAAPAPRAEPAPAPLNV